MLELIDVKTIVEEKLVPYKEETVRRYFNKGVLFSHGRRKNVAHLSYRGSVIARYLSMEKILMRERKRLPLEDIGLMFDRISGLEDDFIVSQLKKNIPIDTIVEEFIAKIVE